MSVYTKWPLLAKKVNYSVVELFCIAWCYSTLFFAMWV